MAAGTMTEMAGWVGVAFGFFGPAPGFRPFLAGAAWAGAGAAASVDMVTVDERNGSGRVRGQ